MKSFQNRQIESMQKQMKGLISIIQKIQQQLLNNFYRGKTRKGLTANGNKELIPEQENCLDIRQV